MWIQMAVKLPRDIGVCQKTAGNLPGDFYAGCGRKTLTFWIGTSIKSQTTVCKWWESLTTPWETITIWTKYQILTALIEFVELNHIRFTHFHQLSDHFLKLWILGDDCGSTTVAEGVFIKMHDRVIIIRGDGHVLTGFIEISLKPWKETLLQLLMWLFIFPVSPL